MVSNPAGTSYDLTLGFGYNNAGQIASATRSNDAYSWTGAANVARGYTANGLNQFTASGAVSLGYDARGNLTSSGSDNYTYSSENLLTSGTVGGVTTPLTYDPLLRLYQIGTSGGMQLVYDGANVIGQSNGTTLGRRYVAVPGSDEVLVEYKVSSGTKDYKLTDERGSVIATTDASGNGSGINTYDEYGIPGSGNSMRFQYTGQFFLTELGLQYSKGRLYSPTLGRFMQTDPIGYGDGLNWYNYVKGDPVNATDPSGTIWAITGFNCTNTYHGVGQDDGTDIVVTQSACTPIVNYVPDLFAPPPPIGGGAPGGDCPSTAVHNAYECLPIPPDSTPPWQPALPDPNPPKMTRQQFCELVEALGFGVGGASTAGTLLKWGGKRALGEAITAGTEGVGAVGWVAGAACAMAPK